MSENEKSNLKEKLIERLRQVEDAYDDFVNGTILFCKDEENGLEKLQSFLDENPKAKSSEILECVADIRGIKKVNKGQQNET